MDNGKLCKKRTRLIHFLSFDQHLISYLNSSYRAEPAPPVNLQLPKINFSNAAKAAASIVVPAEPKIRFAEKTAAPSSSGLIGSLIKRESGESEFKKRKIGDEGVKKNLRTRDSNDD